MESAHAIPWEFSLPDDEWTYVAPQSEQILGYAPEEWADYAFWLDHMHPDDRGWASEYCEACSARGETHVFEYRFRTKAGEYRWLRDVVSVEMADGTPVRLRGYMIDITDRKRSEEQSTHLAEQRETLLREMNHRVKNNLGVLSSLLELQSGSSENEAVTAALRDSQRRVSAIQTIYELLHRHGADERVDAGEYLRTLAEHITTAMSGDGHVHTSCEVVRLPLAPDLLLPLGIITNELITNSLKHAFPDGRRGTVNLSLSTTDESQIELRIADDGVGFDEVDGASAGLGITLVNGLVDQIHGRIRIESSDAGTVATIVFPGDESNGDGR